MTEDFVRAGYDQIAELYVGQRDQFKSLRYMERFAGLLPSDGLVLDVGCGGGKPVDSFLIARGYGVYGLDISPRMIELAKANVPAGHYELANMSRLQTGQFRVAGVVSMYALFHTPRELHGETLRKFASFLPSGGPLLITMGSSEWEGTEDFHGTEMSWSHYGPDRNIELVGTAGFEIVLNEIDRNGEEAHQIVIATKT